ncbi:MAG: extracellular solute-binding protein, partial [Clostridia bacterium]|nr:extracellular solute-binding protein [Clostridia bacterium]
SPSAILPALATGTGPDVLLGLDSTTVIDYALRHVAEPLSSLCPDEEELRQVLARFRESALTGLSFQGEIYALPETQSMTVMFYREDVLSNLGIAAPTAEKPWAWDDLIAALPLLQQNHLTVLMDTSATNNSGLSGLGAYATLLYQRGGAIYEGDGERFGISTALHREEAARAFDFWTSLYTEYGLPAVFNAPNRFRTGEAPIVINDLSLYNTLMVSAPEIRGLWSIAPVPGTLREGEMDLSSYSIPSGAIVLSTSNHKQAAWRFIEWFTQAQTQESYGRDLESLLGASARYFSANVEAFSHLDWSAREKQVLDLTGQWARAVPQVAGGYHLARYINNAFRNVHLGYMEEREALLYFAQVINDELTVKRQEFGLPTLEGGMDHE